MGIGNWAQTCLKRAPRHQNVFSYQVLYSPILCTYFTVGLNEDIQTFILPEKTFQKWKNPSILAPLFLVHSEIEYSNSNQQWFGTKYCYMTICAKAEEHLTSQVFFCWIVLERRTFFAKWSFLRFLGSLHLKKHFFWVLW